MSLSQKTLKNNTTRLSDKSIIHDAKNMLYNWWDQTGVLYYELRKTAEAINGERSGQQFIKLKRAMVEKHPEFVTYIFLELPVLFILHLSVNL